MTSAESAAAVALEPPTTKAPGYVIGGLFAAAALFLLLGSLGFPEPVGRADPGPAFLPRVVGVGLLVCSVLHLVRVPTPAAADERYPALGALVRITSILVAMTAYAYLMRELGFVLTTLLFLSLIHI